MTFQKMALLAIVPCALAGCANSLTIKVVDMDAAYAPIAGATISRYPTPHRGEMWTTTAADVQKTDAQGTTTFAHGAGRFVIDAPGKAPTSFYSSFAPNRMEMGVSAAPMK